MKRKNVLPIGEAVPVDLLEGAHTALAADPLPAIRAKCVVCSGECAPNSTEGLCWVCRRLKISAWRDSDPQPAIQE